MTSTKYIGMDVHTESISIAVRNSIGKIVMECVIETKASTILQFINGLSGDLRVTFEEGTWATWLYDFYDRSLSRGKSSPDALRRSAGVRSWVSSARRVGLSAAVSI